MYALPNYSFFKAARMLSLFQGPPEISWHRAPQKLDTALSLFVPFEVFFNVGVEENLSILRQFAEEISC